MAFITARLVTARNGRTAWVTLEIPNELDYGPLIRDLWDHGWCPRGRADRHDEYFVGLIWKEGTGPDSAWTADDWERYPQEVIDILERHRIALADRMVDDGTTVRTFQMHTEES